MRISLHTLHSDKRKHVLPGVMQCSQLGCVARVSQMSDVRDGLAVAMVALADCRQRQSGACVESKTERLNATPPFNTTGPPTDNKVAQPSLRCWLPWTAV